MGDRESERERERGGIHWDIAREEPHRDIAREEPHRDIAREEPHRDIARGSSQDIAQGGTSQRDHSSGVRGRLRGRLDHLFSARGFGVSLLMVVLGIVAFSVVPLLGTLGTLLGIAAGTFVHGAITDRPQYLEAVLAGSLAVGVSVLLSSLFAVLSGTGTTMLLVALVGGALAGGVGHYFGRDLRDGLTRDLESASPE